MATKDDIIKYVQHTPENTNPSVLGGLLSDLQEGKSIQSDWNQNDETAADYVKNRPFYTSDLVETVFVEEITLPFVEQEGIYSTVFELTFVPTAGEIYKVSWDGTVYECTCVYFKKNLLVGNISLMSDMAPDTGEPFLMIILRDEIFLGTLSTSASHTFSISGFVGGEVVKIDKKFLPAGVSTTALITYDSDTNNFISDFNYDELYDIILHGGSIVIFRKTENEYLYLKKWKMNSNGDIWLSFAENIYGVALHSDGQFELLLR